MSSLDLLKGLKTKLGLDAFGQKTDPFSMAVDVGSKFGVSPIITHKKLYYHYLTDPGVQNAVNTFKDQVVGVGCYLTADDDKALKSVRSWFKKIKFKPKLKTGFNDALITGNEMLEKITSEVTRSKKRLLDLDLVDMRIVTRIEPSEEDPRLPGKVIQHLNGEDVPIPYEDISHFKLFEVSRSFFGIGLFHSLAVPQYEQDNETLSILDDMQKLREAFPRIIKRYASPTTVYIFPDEDEAKIKEEGLKHQQAKQGQAIFTNKDFVYKELSLDPRSRFDRYIDLIQLWYEMGTQTPAAKLQTTPGFTEASARAALELVERRIRGIQEDKKTIIDEEIITPYLIGEGFTPEDANVEFHFGQPDIPEFSLSDIFKAAETIVEGKPLLTWKEARKSLAKIFEIDPEDEVKEEPLDFKKVRINGDRKFITRF